MLSLQEISDRFEIQDLVHRYAQIIDSKEFDLLREDVFCEDAFIDYSVFGGSKGNLETTIEFLHKAMKLFPNTQHLNSNIQIRLDGDRATGRVSRRTASGGRERGNRDVSGGRRGSGHTLPRRRPRDVCGQAERRL